MEEEKENNKKNEKGPESPQRLIRGVPSQIAEIWMEMGRMRSDLEALRGGLRAAELHTGLVEEGLFRKRQQAYKNKGLSEEEKAEADEDTDMDAIIKAVMNAKSSNR